MLTIRADRARRSAADYNKQSLTNRFSNFKTRSRIDSHYFQATITPNGPVCGLIGDSIATTQNSQAADAQN